MTSFVLALACALTGCPQASSGTLASSLNLSFLHGEAPPAVGERRALTVSYGAPGSALMGALIDTSQVGLTRWHAEPADAVRFEEGGAAATFSRPGRVTLWASVTDAQGRVLESNRLEVEVSASGVATVTTGA